MSELFNVDMSPPKHRGMFLAFSSSAQQFRIDVTTSVSPFLEPLTSALRVLRSGYVDETIWLLSGPETCDLCIRAEADSSAADLRVEWWPDHKRGVAASARRRSVFSVRGTRDEIISPFVAALQRLRTSTDDAEFEAEYGAPFPTAEFNMLVGPR